MLHLPKLQKDIVANKKAKGFNTKDIPLEFCLLMEEVSEAFGAYRKKLPDFGEELADIAIYLLGLAELTGINLEKEIIDKVAKNEKREYKKVKGIFVRK